MSQASYSPLDSVKVFDLLGMSDKSVETSAFDSAAWYCQRALDISTQKKFLRGEAHAHIKIADIGLQKGEFKQVGRHDSISLKTGLLLKDSLLIGLSYYQLGLLATYQSNYNKGLDYFTKALQVKFEKDQSSTTAVVYNDIGYMYGQQGDLEKQLEWLLKALRLYDKMKDDAGMAQTLNNISTSLNEAGRIAEAIEYGRKAIDIRKRIDNKMGLAISYNNLAQLYMRIDSLKEAIRYQQEGLKYAEMTGIAKTISHSYITMALLLNRQRNNPEALVYEKKAIQLMEKEGDQNMLARRYIAAAILSGSQSVRDSAGALEYFQKAYDLSVALNNKFNLRDIYLHRAIFYKDRKDFYNAYESYKQYIKYKDSIISSETLAKMAEIETKYETEKKDQAIAQLNAEQKIKQLELEKQNAVIAGNKEEAKRKQNEIDLLVQSGELQELKIQQQEKELEKQLLLAKTSEQQLQLAEKEKQLHEKQMQSQKQLRNALVAGAILMIILTAVLFNRYQLKKKLEQQKMLQHVRNNIARDLHDEIGSTLTSINILSQVSHKNLAKDLAKSSLLLGDITEQSQNIQQAMSDIVWAIKPDNDRMENMVTRMREYISHMLELKDVDIEFDVDDNILRQPLAMEQRRDFFLIFKEAVNNASKYSQATSVSIHLDQSNGAIRLTVEDNGIGFNTSAFTSSNGLKNMKERAAALNGRLHVQSAPGKGTTVSLQFPGV